MSIVRGEDRPVLERGPGLTECEAADLLWLFNDPSLDDKLVRQRGWSSTTFQEWLTESLLRNLLNA